MSFERFRAFVETHHDCDPGLQIRAIERRGEGTQVKSRVEVSCPMCLAREVFRFDLIDDMKLVEYLGDEEVPR